MDPPQKTGIDRFHVCKQRSSAEYHGICASHCVQCTYPRGEKKRSRSSRQPGKFIPAGGSRKHLPFHVRKCGQEIVLQCFIAKIPCTIITDQYCTHTDSIPASYAFASPFS